MGYIEHQQTIWVRLGEAQSGYGESGQGSAASMASVGKSLIVVVDECS